MVDSFREAFRRNLAQRQVLRGQMTPPAPQPVFRPVATSPGLTNQFIAAKVYAAQIAQRHAQATPPTMTPQQATALIPRVPFDVNGAPNTQQIPVAPAAPGRNPNAPGQFGMGGSGVYANDILGQFGPVVLPPDQGAQFRPGSPENPQPIAPQFSAPTDQFNAPQAQELRFLAENMQETSGLGTPQQMLDMTFDPTTGQPNVPKQTLAGYEQARTGAVTPEQERADAAAEAQREADEQAAADAKIALDSAYEHYLQTPNDQTAAAYDAAQKTYVEAVAKVPGPDVAAKVFNLIDTPRVWVIEEMGNNAYDVAVGEKDDWSAELGAIAPGNWMVPGLDSTRLTQDFETWVEDPDNWAAIRNAKENGFQASLTEPRYTDGRAVWELFINGAGNAYKAFMDVFLDPQVLFQPIADVGVGVRVLTTAEAVAAKAAGRGISPWVAAADLGGAVLKAPQQVLNVTADLPFTLAGKYLERLGPWTRGLTTETPAGQAARQGEEVAEAVTVAESVPRTLTDQPPGPGGTTGPPPQGGTGAGPGQPTGNVGPIVGYPPGAQTPPTTAAATTPTVATVGDRFTMRQEGNEWVIYNPQGVPTGDRFPWEPTTGAEPPRSTRDVQRHVDALNQPLIQADLRAQGWVLPDEINQLNQTSPTYQPVTNRGQALPFPNIQTTVARDVNLGTPELRQQWLDEFVPNAARHEATMAEIRARETNASLLGGGSLEREYVQKGREIIWPPKTLEVVRFVAEDTLAPFKRTFPGIDPPPYRFVTNATIDTTDINNVIEHAVFGTADTLDSAGKVIARGTATEARAFLTGTARNTRVATLNGMTYAQLADELRRLRVEIGEPLSMNPRSIARREAAARAAGLPPEQQVAAAMGDLNLPAQAQPGVAAAPSPDLPEPTVATVPVPVAAPMETPVGQTPAGYDITASPSIYGERYQIGDYALYPIKGTEGAKFTILQRPAPGFPMQAIGQGSYTHGINVIEQDLRRANITPDALRAQSLPIEPTAVAPTPEPTLEPLAPPKPPVQSKKVGRNWHDTVDLSGDDDAIRRQISKDNIQIGRKWVSPDGNQVAIGQPSRNVTVGRRNGVNAPAWMDLIPSERGKKTIWTIRSSKLDVPPGEAPTLAEAIAIADELLSVTKRGPVQTPALVKQVTDEVAETINVPPSVGPQAAGEPWSVQFSKGVSGDVRHAYIPGDDIHRAVLTRSRTPEGSKWWVTVWDKTTDPQTTTEVGRFDSLVDARKAATKALEQFRPAVSAPTDIPQPRIGSQAAGIISPAARRNQELAIRARDKILRREGAVVGPGGARLSDGDLSHIGAAHRMGWAGMDDTNYAILTRKVDYEGDRITLWEAYERSKLNAPATLDAAEKIAWAREQAALNLIDPKLKAQLDARKALIESRTAHSKAWRFAYKALEVYDTALTHLRESTMYNWAHGFNKFFSDRVSNAYTAAVNREPRSALKALGIVDMSSRQFTQVNRGKRQALEGLPDWDWYHKVFGTDPPRSATNTMTGRLETGADPVVLKQKTGRFYNLFRYFADNDLKAWRTGTDQADRYALTMHSARREIESARQRFRGIVVERANQTGNDPTEWLTRLDGMGDDMNAAEVFTAFGDTRLKEDWAGLTRQAKIKSRETMENLFFSYKQLGIDEKLRNVLFFHYWMSRAAILHTKTAIRNPYLLNAYVRAWNYMEKEAEANGYPPNVRGFIRLMGSESGMYGLVSPASLLVPFWFLIEGAMDEGDPGTVGFIQRWGGFLNPIVEGAAAALGHSTNVPDVTATRAVRRAFRYTINFLNSNGYDGLVPDVLGEPNTWQQSDIDAAEFNFYTTVNSWIKRGADALAPTQDWIREYDGTNPAGYEEDQLNSIVINQLEETYGPYETWEENSPPFDELKQAMQDIALGTESNNPVAEAAIEEFADAKAQGVLLTGLLPGGVYQRYGPRDQTMAEARAGEDQAYDQREIATSGNPTLAIQSAEMERLGTETGRKGYDLWNDIAYGEHDYLGYLVIGDEWISAQDLDQMNTDDRKELADRWLAQYEGVLDEKTAYDALRTEYLAANPEMGDFKEYQSGVSRYEGGPNAWRQLFAKDHEDFANAMEAAEQRFRDQGKTGGVLDAEMEQWTRSPDAYNAAIGERESVYEEERDATAPDFGFEEQESGGSGGTKKSDDPLEGVKTTIERYEKKVDEALAKMQAAGYSVTRADIDTPNPYYRSIFASFGVPKEMPEDYWLFLQWKALQPAGVTLDGYINYLRAEGQRQAAA